MQIRFGHDAQGGFVAGDEFTGATCYAYPSSTHAKQAHKDARKVAIKMLTKEIEFRRTVRDEKLQQMFREGDQRRWPVLNGDGMTAYSGNGKK